MLRRPSGNACRGRGSRAGRNGAVGAAVGDAGRGEAPTPDLIGPLFTDRLCTLAARRVPVLLVYGENDSNYRDFQMARSGPLGHLFGPDSTLAVRTLPGNAHGLRRVSTQQAFLDLTVDFLSTVA